MKDLLSRDEAREVVAIALSGSGPTAEQASIAFDAEYEEALRVLYPDHQEGQMQQTVTLVSAERKSGNSKKGPWHFYVFKDAGGNTWQTAFNSGLGSQLAGALDQSVTLTYHEETRGDFTNSVIDHAEFGGSGSAPTEAPTSVNAETVAAPSSKDESIARAVAFKGAIDLASHGVLDADKDGIIEVAQHFEGYLLTGKVAETVRY